MHREHSFHILMTIIITVSGAFLLLIFSFLTVWLASLTRTSKLSPLIKQYYFFPSEVVLNYGEVQFATPSATLTRQTTSQVQPVFHDQKVKAWIENIAREVDRPATNAAVITNKSSKRPFVIVAGSYGTSVDQASTLEQVFSLPKKATTSASLIIVRTGKVLTPDAIITLEKRVGALVSKTIILTAAHASKRLGIAEITSLFDLPEGYDEEKIDALLASFSASIAAPPVEPQLVIEDGLVKEFVAPKDGYSVSKDVGKDKIIAALRVIESTKISSTVVSLELSYTRPETSLSDLNTLGIEERLGFGESWYRHSIPNRIHNVSLTTAKIHAVLIQPGREFSFVKYLGEVSQTAGFKPAYVIKEGQTVLGDGGGICQVSSTFFRAVLNAGLPITERKSHSYRVGYYEQNSNPGFDATVYSPHPDFRFVNDTNSPLLVNAVADPKTQKMYIELYGKPDGRKAEVTNYRQWDLRPAPPRLYQDDSTIPRGTLKQIEFAAPGLKTSFDYTIIYPDGERKQKTFRSDYIPWRAVYLRGV